MKYGVLRIPYPSDLQSQGDPLSRISLLCLPHVPPESCASKILWASVFLSYPQPHLQWRTVTAPDFGTSTSMAALHELQTQIQQTTRAMNLISVRLIPRNLLHTCFPTCCYFQNTIDQLHKEATKGEQELHPEIQKYV